MKVMNVNWVKYLVHTHRKKELRNVSYSYFFSLNEIVHVMPWHRVRHKVCI